MATTLCSFCSQIDVSDALYNIWTHHTYTELQQSKQNGCQCCGLILDEVNAQVKAADSEIVGSAELRRRREEKSVTKPSSLRLEMASCSLLYTIFDYGKDSRVIPLQLFRKRGTSNVQHIKM